MERNTKSEFQLLMHHQRNKRRRFAELAMHAARLSREIQLKSSGTKTRAKSVMEDEIFPNLLYVDYWHRIPKMFEFRLVSCTRTDVDQNGERTANLDILFSSAEIESMDCRMQRKDSLKASAAVHLITES